MCITAPKTGAYSVSTLSFYNIYSGNIATNGLIYRYVYLWSNPATWGGNFAPMEGDSVEIPVGLNLLVDV